MIGHMVYVSLVEKSIQLIILFFFFHSQFHIFSKQVHALEIKFDACGLFSMDFDTVFSVRQ